MRHDGIDDICVRVKKFFVQPRVYRAQYLGVGALPASVQNSHLRQPLPRGSIPHTLTVASFATVRNFMSSTHPAAIC